MVSFKTEASGSEGTIQSEMSVAGQLAAGFALGDQAGG